jgi:hypothetical protein
MPTNIQFLTDRITATEAIIVAIEAAVVALSTAGVESYSLDTGQSVQRVTKADIARLNTQLDSTYNRYVMLCQRRDGPGGGTMIARPGF